jgi:hypothetical protein
MILLLKDESGLFVYASAEAAVNDVEPFDADGIEAAFDDSAVPYRVEWIRPHRRKILFGLLESDEPGVFSLVPAGPPEPAALLALLEAHSSYTNPPEAHAAVIALLEKLRRSNREQPG